MTIINYINLSINGQVVKYEGRLKIEAGTITRTFNPQVNGEIVVTSDISTNMSKITIPVRVTAASSKTFKEFYDNGDNNVITADRKSFTKCALEVLPEREDQEIVEYIFMGNPEI